jgi:hypothetical protein
MSRGDIGSGHFSVATLEGVVASELSPAAKRGSRRVGPSEIATE